MSKANHRLPAPVLEHAGGGDHHRGARWRARMASACCGVGDAGRPTNCTPTCTCDGLLPPGDISPPWSKRDPFYRPRLPASFLQVHPNVQLILDRAAAPREK